MVRKGTFLFWFDSIPYATLTGYPVYAREKGTTHKARVPRLISAAKLGRMATHNPKAEALRGATQSRQRAAERAWNPEDLPEWLAEQVYREKIQPLLATVKVRTIMSVLGVSRPYATEVGRKKRVPHPRHWVNLARLVGIVGQD